MTFEVFKEKIEEILKEKYPDYEITIKPVLKNNGVNLTGVNFFENGEEQPKRKVSSVFYLESAYNPLMCEDELPALATKIFKHCTVSYNDELEKVIDELYEYEKVKDKIIPCLVNGEMNQTFKQRHICREFSDFLITYKVELVEGATVNIHDGLLNVWNITRDELHEQAMSNLEEYETTDVLAMMDMIDELHEKSNIFDVEIDVLHATIRDAIGMYILTNKTRVCGARVILKDSLLDDLYKRFNRSFYLIPSSIHEWIIILNDLTESNSAQMNCMLREVNETQVPTEELLGNRVLYYDGKELTPVDD